MNVQSSLGRRVGKQPAWDPLAQAVKLKCAGNRVYGWSYPDGTLELICREKGCRRSGYETRHMMNPANGLTFDIWVPDAPV